LQLITNEKEKENIAPEASVVAEEDPENTVDQNNTGN